MNHRNQSLEATEAIASFPPLNNTSRVVILGSSGHASEVYSVIHTNMIDVAPVVFIDKHQEQLLEDGDLAFLGMGSPAARENCFETFRNLYQFPTLIHPSAMLGVSVRVGAGTLIQSGVSITTLVEIGYGCLININSTIGHDVVIGDFSVVNPGATVSGSVTIGKSVLIGANATVLENISIGDGARVGAGAVVTRNVKRGETVIGVPARPL